LDNYAQRRREYLRTRWVPQGWAYIQPVQDIQARMMEVNAGFNSRSEMVLRSGYDAETVDAENAADQARAQKLGLNYKTLVDQPEPAADKETP
jgi:capsid protein